MFLICFCKPRNHVAMRDVILPDENASIARMVATDKHSRLKMSDDRNENERRKEKNTDMLAVNQTHSPADKAPPRHVGPGLSWEDVKQLNVAEPQQVKTSLEMAAEHCSDADDERDEGGSKNTTSMTIDDCDLNTNEAMDDVNKIPYTSVERSQQCCVDKLPGAKLQTRRLQHGGVKTLDLSQLFVDTGLAEKTTNGDSLQVQALNEQLEKVRESYRISSNICVHVFVVYS